MSTEVREAWFHALGARTLRANEPKGTRAQFEARGFPPAYWRHYEAGYEEAFEQLDRDEREAVAGAYFAEQRRSDAARLDAAMRGSYPADLND